MRDAREINYFANNQFVGNNFITIGKLFLRWNDNISKSFNIYNNYIWKKNTNIMKIKNDNIYYSRYGCMAIEDKSKLFFYYLNY